MCSLKEAFAPITPFVPGQGDGNYSPASGVSGGGMRSYNGHGFDPMGPGQGAWNPTSQMPDGVGQYVTQADDHRQWAQPANGLEHQRWLDNWGQPNPSQFRRGVHSDRSRENRMGPSRRHQVPTGTGGAAMQSAAEFPNRARTGAPGAPFDQYPQDADYTPPYINALDGSAAPGAPVSSVGSAPRAAERRSRLKDTFGSVSQPRENTVGPVPNPSDYRNMHPTQWDDKISGAPVQARQFNPGMGPSANMRESGSGTGLRDLTELMMDAPTPTSTDEVRRLQEQIRRLTAKLDDLEKKVGKVESSRSHDIILIVVLAVFLLFIVDNVFGFNKLT